MSNYNPKFVSNRITSEQEKKWAEDAVRLKIETEGINGKTKQLFFTLYKQNSIPIYK